MFSKFLFALTFVCLTMMPAAASSDNEKTTAGAKRGAKKLSIKVVPWGPTQADVAAARQRAAASAVVRRELNGANYRELGFEYIYDTNETKSQESRPPTRFRVIYYNYTTDLTLQAEGNFAGTEPITAYWVNSVPGVIEAEMAAAHRILDQDAGVAERKRKGDLKYYKPMPPTTVINGERIVNVGITEAKTGENEIVGVNFKTGQIVKYPNNAPPTSAATPEACGVADANQPSSIHGTAGQATLTVNDAGGNPLWQMLIVRPSASSGRAFERSGLEIRDVKYKGKSVLKRGHVPILNVKYTTGCGPFRDWQWEEGNFNAPDAGAQDIAPGIRILASGQVATTVVESRNDTGNFRGVAIYVQNTEFGQEVVLVTEMEAGWYRYIMEWRFAPDGTIRPRYGFGSVSDTCVCIQRTHHAYWRFDFDIVNAANKVFLLDRGRKFRKPIETEGAFFKRGQTSRSLLIQNAAGNEAYQLVPGTNDGTVTDANGNLTDAFGAGDFWVMRFKGTSAAPDELDDADGPQYPGAYLDPWVNGESMDSQDVVVWYGAHQVRVDDASRPNAPQVITGSHIIGPTLRPVLW